MTNRNHAGRIGLTGGIGSGKSTVAGLFRELGVLVVDSDEISRELTSPGGAAMAAIQSHFGADYVDAYGALNRDAMRKRIFSDVEAKHRLEAILHPMIRTQMLASVNTVRSPYVVMVVPLLLELADYRALVHRVLLVDCSEDIQVARVTARSGMAEAEVRAIMAAQCGRDERLNQADDVITNEGDIAALHSQVLSMHERYLHLYAGSD